jgi:hypothetical protein
MECRDSEACRVICGDSVSAPVSLSLDFLLNSFGAKFVDDRFFSGEVNGCPYGWVLFLLPLMTVPSLLNPLSLLFFSGFSCTKIIRIILQLNTKYEL